MTKDIIPAHMAAEINRKREVRAIANFLMELQGNAEDAMALVEEGDFDSEFVAMLEEDIEDLDAIYRNEERRLRNYDDGIIAEDDH